MSRTAAVVGSPQASEGQAWWFLDTLVVEHPMASGAGPVVLEMALPAGAAPLLHLHHDLDDSSFLLDEQMVVLCGTRRCSPGPATGWRRRLSWRSTASQEQ
jgi:hypothetical protein